MNAFRSCHPLVGCLYYGGATALLLLYTHPLFLLAGLGFLLAQLVRLDGRRALRAWGGPYLAVGLSFLLVNPLINHRGRHIVGYLWDQPITLEAIAYGAVTALSVGAVWAACQTAMRVVTAERWLYLFAGVAPKAAMLAVMTMRFVPLFRRRLDEIALVQRSLGLDAAGGGWIARLRSGVRLVQQLLVVSLEEAMQAADSMRARGYGTGPRTAYRRYRFDRRDAGLLAAGVALWAVCAVGWWTGAGTYRIIPSFGPLWPDAAGSGALAAWLAYGSMPIMAEWRERRQWRSSE